MEPDLGGDRLVATGPGQAQPKKTTWSGLPVGSPHCRESH